MESIVTIPSFASYDQTLDNVIRLIGDKGFKIFARIDHSAEARQHRLSLEPTELVIFGNPAVGTFLMQDKQTCGLDLPAKILVWRDASGKVFLTYHRMKNLKDEHHLLEESEKILDRIDKTVEEICHSASGNTHAETERMSK